MKTYFFQAAAGPIKIGKSRNPVRRLAGLTWHEPVAFLGYLDGDREKELHDRFSSIRLRGEWFQATDELRTFILEFATRTEPSDDSLTDTLGPGKFVRFPPELLRQIEAIAIAEERTVSAVIRRLAEEAVSLRSSGPEKRSAA